MAPELARRADPGEHQELRRDVRPGREDDLPLRADLLGGTGRPPEPARVPIRAVQALTGQVADADDPPGITLVEYEPGDVAVRAHFQAALRPHRLDALARVGSVPVLADGRGHGDEADATSFEHPQVVRVDLRPGTVLAEQRPVEEAERKLPELGSQGLDDDPADGQVVRVDRLADEVEHVGEPGRQPPVPAVAAGRVFAVEAALDPLEVLVHLLGSPARVTGGVADGSPVAVVRPDDDHRVVRRTAAERAGARIVDAAPTGRALHQILRVPLLARLVRVVTNVMVEAHLLVLGGQTVVGRHPIVPGRLLASRFQEEHRVSLLGQSRRYRPTAGAGADDDVLVPALGRRLRSVGHPRG